MRAGRLVSLLLLLQVGRHTARELAEALEVSERTILRDVDELSSAGIPVFAVRGPKGGFELLDGQLSRAAGVTAWPAEPHGRMRRATVRISPEGRRLAAVLNRLQPLRVRPEPRPGEWVEATLRVVSFERAAIDLLSLGPEVEVLAPPALRQRVAELARATASVYRSG